MPISVQWDDDAHTIVRHHYEGRWDWQDFYVAAEEAWRLMRSVEHRVDAILDVRQGAPLPTGLLPHAKRVVTRRPANAGLIVIVGASKIIQSMYDVFRRVYGRLNPRFRIVFVRTLEDARDAIAVARSDDAQPSGAIPVVPAFPNSDTPFA